jgi:hypothetical protein
MDSLRAPRIQIALVITVFYAGALVVLINTPVVSVLAGIFVLGLPPGAGAALWLARRSGVSGLTITDMSPSSVLADFATWVLLAVSLAFVAGQVIEPADWIGRACLTGLTFGTAFAIGDVVGKLVEQRRRRGAGQGSG